MSDKTELLKEDLNLTAQMDERLKKLETLLDEALAKETPESLTEWLLSKRSIAPIEQVEQPKEKAKELFEKYQNLLIANYDLDGEDYLTKAHSKQCAIIAVDEILKHIPEKTYGTKKGYYPNPKFEFYKEVKNHLNNM
jgi:hypothetical protein